MVKNIWGMFPTTVSSSQRIKLESGLEHKFKALLRKRTGNRHGDRAACKVFRRPPSKSSPLTRTGSERTRTTTMTRTQVHLKQSWVRYWPSQAGLKSAAWKEDPGVARQEQSGLVRVTLFQWFSVREDSKRCIRFQTYKTVKIIIDVRQNVFHFIKSNN